MKLIIASWLLVVIGLGLGCDNIVPKAASVELSVNNTKLASVPYQNDGTVLVDMGMDESAPIAEQEAALDNGPWYVWPANQNLLVIEKSGPGVWTTDCGLYMLSQGNSMEGTSIRFQVGERLEPASEDDQVMTYDWDAMASSQSSNSGSSGLFFAIKTPYEKGCYLVSVHKKFVMVDTN